jgi:glycosyltransferase involved in cell wall biosynthesis
MRIALILPGFSAHVEDWAIPALLNLACRLAQTHDLHIFSQRYPARGIYHFAGLTHHAVGGGQRFGLHSLKIWLQTAQAIVTQHQKTPFDLLHAFWVDEAGFSAVLAGARIRRPVVVSLGGGELTRLPDIAYGAQRFLMRRLTTRYALKRACIVTAGSNYQLDLCRTHHVPEQKLRLAPLGVDTQHFYPKRWKFGKMEDWRDVNELTTNHQSSNPPPLHPSIIQVASLLPVKNQALLLETVKLVKEEVPTIRLNMIGSGPLKSELTQLTHHLKIDQNVTWQQPVPYLSLRHFYQHSHLYLQTSRHESQGMAVLEVMACGLPVVGTPVGVVREVASLPAQVGKEGLAAQILQVLSNPIQHEGLSHQARQIVESRFSLDVTTETFVEIYKKGREK